MKKLLLSAAISFALNVVYTGILISLTYFNIYRFKKDSAVRIPLYFATRLFEIINPQINETGKPNIKYLLFSIFVVYLLNTMIYALPIYVILRFVTRNKQPKHLPSAEPPPPPLF
ncbi:MAG TPA: hypothetical protein PKY59_04015 [Pyrinomonadaceae bacterium]|nr:hypothetical protein [Pyrinomonadaceae bacterium]